MTTTSPTLMTMLKGHMKYMTERQEVLAHNIANIDTPGYKARDLKKADFGDLANAESKRLSMRATAPGHMNGTLGTGGAFAVTQDRNTFETSPTKNNVVLEDQMAKISDTGAHFQLSSSLMRKFVQLYRTASGSK